MPPVSSKTRERYHKILTWAAGSTQIPFTLPPEDTKQGVVDFPPEEAELGSETTLAALKKAMTAAARQTEEPAAWGGWVRFLCTGKTSGKVSEKEMLDIAASLGFYPEAREAANYMHPSRAVGSKIDDKELSAAVQAIAAEVAALKENGHLPKGRVKEILKGEEDEEAETGEGSAIKGAASEEGSALAVSEKGALADIETDTDGQTENGGGDGDSGSSDSEKTDGGPPEHTSQKDTDSEDTEEEEDSGVWDHTPVKIISEPIAARDPSNPEIHSIWEAEKNKMPIGSSNISQIFPDKEGWGDPSAAFEEISAGGAVVLSNAADAGTIMQPRIEEHVLQHPEMVALKARRVEKYSEKLFAHPSIKGAGATPDMIVELTHPDGRTEHAIVECKFTARFDQFTKTIDNPESPHPSQVFGKQLVVPVAYGRQIQFQLDVLGLNTAYLAVYDVNRTFNEPDECRIDLSDPIPRNRAVIDMARAHAGAFLSCLEKGVAPLDDHDYYMRFYPDRVGVLSWQGTIANEEQPETVADPETLEIYYETMEIKRRISLLKKEEEARTSKLRRMIGAGGKLVDRNGNRLAFVAGGKRVNWEDWLADGKTKAADSAEEVAKAKEAVKKAKTKEEKEEAQASLEIAQHKAKFARDIKIVPLREGRRIVKDDNGEPVPDIAKTLAANLHHPAGDYIEQTGKNPSLRTDKIPDSLLGEAEAHIQSSLRSIRED